MTASVVGAIAPKLEQAEIERAKRKPTESLDAYDYYLRGMAAFHQWTRRPTARRCRLFYKAIELDPDFASAYGMAAWCYVRRKVEWLDDRPRAGDRRRHARLARRAVELGKDDAVALTRGGHALAHFGGDLDGGIALIDRALALNPNSGGCLVPRRIPGTYRGETDQAIEYLHARHAPQSARPGDVSNAGRDGAGAFVRGAL